MDLLDSFTAIYKFPMKSRRWYVYMFWHTIILAVINAWLLQAGAQSSKDAKAGDPDQETVSGRSSILSHPGKNAFLLFAVCNIFLYFTVIFLTCILMYI